jgi:hypothetical protein
MQNIKVKRYSKSFLVNTNGTQQKVGVPIHNLISLKSRITKGDRDTMIKDQFRNVNNNSE